MRIATNANIQACKKADFPPAVHDATNQNATVNSLTADGEHVETPCDQTMYVAGTVTVTCHAGKWGEPDGTCKEKPKPSVLWDCECIISEYIESYVL